MFCLGLFCFGLWGFFVCLCFVGVFHSKDAFSCEKEVYFEVDVMSLFWKLLKPKLLKRTLNKIVLFLGAFTLILLIKFSKNWALLICVSLERLSILVCMLSWVFPLETHERNLLFQQNHKTYSFMAAHQTTHDNLDFLALNLYFLINQKITLTLPCYVNANLIDI